MLKKQMKQYLADLLEGNKDETIELYKEEKEYLEKYLLMEDDVPPTIKYTEKEVSSRFSKAYIERCDKETEELLANETATFLDEPIDYFNKHKNEFIYLESKWFELIGVDAISLEVDDVFGNFDVMLGLKLQKKFEGVIKEHLHKMLNEDDLKYDLMFNQDDGLWNLNFSLNEVEGFREDLLIGEAVRLIYSFMFELVEAIEVG
jgi:hypothetical protein